MSDFTITSQPIPRNAAALKLEGAQTDADFENLAKEFATILDAGTTGIVLDMSATTAMTSAGLGAIIDLSRTLAVRDGKLLVAAPSAEVTGLIDLLGIRNALAFVDSVSDGKKAVSAF